MRFAIVVAFAGLLSGASAASVAASPTSLPSLSGTTPPSCLLACATTTGCQSPGDMGCQCSSTGGAAMQRCIARACNDDHSLALTWFASRCAEVGQRLQVASLASAPSTGVSSSVLQASSTVQNRASSSRPANAATSSSSTQRSGASATTLPRGELLAVFVLAGMYFMTM
ncbi:hypothetical protein PYCC9005_001406 [Savitreella phatthalungensis]